MNRAVRRKRTTQLVNNLIKARADNVRKKQFGFGLVVTNRMITIIFGFWAWSPWDRRRS